MSLHLMYKEELIWKQLFFLKVTQNDDIEIIQNPTTMFTTTTPSPPAASIDDLAPKDAPIGTYRYKLIKYMTDTNLTIKRFISELLYELCHKNAELFVDRTGFGNACALLKGRGILESVQANMKK